MLVEKRAGDFLQSLGYGHYVHQGSDVAPATPPTREKNQAFVAVLNSDLRRTDMILGLAVGLLLVFSLAFLGLALWQARSPATAGALIAGDMGSLLVFFWPLRQLWIERTLLGALVAIIPELEPVEAVKAVSAMYESLRKKRG